MSIYRSILEDCCDIPVLDDNNNMDLKDIEDIVNCMDANCEEQKQAQDAEFGPDEGVDDIMGESFGTIQNDCDMILAECMMEQNAIVKAIGIYELNEAVNGREVVLEAVDIKAFISKAIESAKALLAKVVKALKQALDNATAKVVENKKLLAKKAAIMEGYNKMKTKPSIVGYDYSDVRVRMDRYIGKNSPLNYRSNKATSQFILSFVKNLEAGYSRDMATDIEATELGEDLVKNYIKDIIPGKDSKKSFAKDFGSYLRGSKKDVTMEGKQVIQTLEFSSEIIKKLNGILNDTKDDFARYIKMLREVEKGLKADKELDGRKAIMSKCKTAISSFNAIQSISTSAKRVMIAVVMQRNYQAIKFANIYLRAAKGEKAEVKSESQFGFLRNLQLV